MMITLFRTSLAVLCCGVFFTLAGCSLTPTAAPATERGLAISGVVHGGSEPITGAQIYLFAANTTGYGGANIAASTANASVSLLRSTATTYMDTSGGPTNGDYYTVSDSSGNFSITGDYACTPNSQVYLYVLGGNPGAGVNSGSGLMAVFGNCPTAGNFLGTVPLLVINEVTTVAAAYAFAGFATDAVHVSSSGTPLALQGITNAFANANNLAYIVSGNAQSGILSGYGTAPQATVDTLGNILAACVNTNGTITGPTNPTACYTLFNNARSNGSTGTLPTDTASAAINIAHNPGQNVASLYPLAAPAALFAPALSSQPNDFTLGLKLTGGGIDVPYNLAIDGNGYVWLANNAPFMSVFAPNGAPVTPSSGGYDGIGGVGTYGTGLQGNFQLAIDTSNNVWVTEDNTKYIAEFNAPGNVPAYVKSVNISPYSDPGYITIDPSGNLWITNGGSTPSLIELAAGTLALSDFPGNGLSSPDGIASDANGNIWVSNNGTGTVSEFNAGAAVTGSPFAAGGAFSYPHSIAAGLNGDMWVPSYSNTITLINQAGANVVSGGTGGVGGLADPYNTAIDGAGNAWIANASTNGAEVSEFNSAGTAITSTLGYGYGSLDHFGGNGVAGIAVDGSGNVWCLDSNTGNGGTLVELVGAAVPAITPISLAVKNNAVGTEP